jgi:hypothetical protein
VALRGHPRVVFLATLITKSNFQEAKVSIALLLSLLKGAPDAAHRLSPEKEIDL